MQKWKKLGPETFNPLFPLLGSSLQDIWIHSY